MALLVLWNESLFFFGSMACLPDNVSWLPGILIKIPSKLRLAIDQLKLIFCTFAMTDRTGDKVGQECLIDKNIERVIDEL